MNRNKRITLIISILTLLQTASIQAEQPIENNVNDELSTICQSSANSLTFSNPEQSSSFVSRCINAISNLPVADQIELDAYIVDELTSQCEQGQGEATEQSEEQLNNCVTIAALQWLGSSPKQIEE